MVTTVVRWTRVLRCFVMLCACSGIAGRYYEVVCSAPPEQPFFGPPGHRIWEDPWNVTVCMRNDDGRGTGKKKIKVLVIVITIIMTTTTTSRRKRELGQSKVIYHECPYSTRDRMRWRYFVLVAMSLEILCCDGRETNAGLPAYTRRVGPFVEMAFRLINYYHCVTCTAFVCARCVYYFFFPLRLHRPATACVVTMMLRFSPPGPADEPPRPRFGSSIINSRGLRAQCVQRA